MAGAPPFREIERTVLYDEVSRHIKQAIVNGVYQPGDRLPSERDLAEAFGVGRPTVREALKILAMQGFISMERRQAGYVIRTPDLAQYVSPASNLLTWLTQLNEQTIDSFLEVIPYLRSMIAHAAIKNRGPELDAALQDILRRMEEGEQTFYAINPLGYEFTLRLAQATDDGVIIALWGVFEGLLCERFPPVMTSFEPEGPGRLIQYHREMTEAISKGDHEGIDRAVRARRERIGELNAARASEH